MALPKINNPIFELTLPSTGQSVKYRPFLVKEQKILLLAAESESSKSTLMAVKQIINNCLIDDNIDVDKLPTFDIEYFFIRLRAKSIGETVDLRMRHPTGFNSKDAQCEHITSKQINLLEIEVEKAIEHTDKIILDEETGVGIKLKYPTVTALDDVDMSKVNNQVDGAIENIISAIDYIFDKDNIYKKEDSSKEELTQFLEGLSQDQFIKVTRFFETMPKVKSKVKWKCAGCGCEDEVTLEGMQSFFAF